MNKPQLRAGTMEELKSPSGEWVFVDIGFSRTRKTCGCLVATYPFSNAAEVKSLTYGCLNKKLGKLAGKGTSPLHLVIEAPLSVAFAQDGNPVGRRLERDGSKTRYWYVGLGCSVLVASLCVIKKLIESERTREIRLFEGFVSFGNQGIKSNHEADVKALMNVVSTSEHDGMSEAEPNEPEGSLVSILDMLGHDPTPPPIIKADKPVSD